MKLLLIDTQNVYDAIRQIDPQLRLDYKALEIHLGPFRAKIAFVKGEIIRGNAFADHLVALNYQIVYRRRPIFDIDFAWYAAQIIRLDTELIIISNSLRLKRLYQKFNAVQTSGLKFQYSVHGYNMPYELGQELPSNLLITLPKKYAPTT